MEGYVRAGWEGEVWVGHEEICRWTTRVEQVSSRPRAGVRSSSTRWIDKMCAYRYLFYGSIAFLPIALRALDHRRRRSSSCPAPAGADGGGPRPGSWGSGGSQGETMGSARQKAP